MIKAARQVKSKNNFTHKTLEERSSGMPDPDPNGSQIHSYEVTAGPLWVNTVCRRFWISIIEMSGPADFSFKSNFVELSCSSYVC